MEWEDDSWIDVQDDLPSYEERFRSVEPYYLAIGMTHNEFWYGDPWLAATYREAHAMRSEMKSQEMWLQGVYFYNALSTALGNFGQSFAKHKRQPRKYMSEPIRLTPLTELEKKKKEYEERQKAIDFFSRLQRDWDKKQGKAGD